MEYWRHWQGSSTSSGIPVSAVDKAADAGISENTRTYGAIIADFNIDAKPDIFLGRHGEQPRLYEHAGNGHFQETNQDAFARADRHGCDAADVNGDGLKDIFCTEGALQGTSAKRNELYIQRTDHTFAVRTGQYGVLVPFGRGVRPGSSKPMATDAPIYSWLMTPPEAMGCPLPSGSL